MTKRRRKNPTKNKSVTTEYEPTPQDRAAAKAYAERENDLLPLSPLKIQKVDGVTHVTTDHPEQPYDKMKLANALASTDDAFIDGIITQLVKVRSQDQGIDEGGVNFMVSVIRGIEPKDQMETMLAAQMAAVHNATMTFARRLNHVDNIQQQDSAERAFNRLGRTFTTQMEALKRYRTSGQQKMTVEHVHVHEGGQAIVGNVGGGLSKKSGPTS
ncbi:MAG: hypothetical protein OSB69_16065 [Alphaproteobacteria bacterium]|nr:hypothetical protein [Alphaproteobacteria bacterium]